MSITEFLNNLRSRYPKSDFLPLGEEELEEVRKRLGDIPQELTTFFRIIGRGTIGDSRYQIHAFVDPRDIYDPQTADRLRGKVIVGDDFAGNCDAYDYLNGWIFGTIDESGDFNPNESHSSLLEFLDWFLLKEES